MRLTPGPTLAATNVLLFLCAPRVIAGKQEPALDHTLAVLSAAPSITFQSADMAFGGEAMIFHFKFTDGSPLVVKVERPRADAWYQARYGGSSFAGISLAPKVGDIQGDQPNRFHVLARGSRMEAKLHALLDDTLTTMPAATLGREDLTKLHTLLGNRDLAWETIAWAVITQNRKALDELIEELKTATSITFKKADAYLDGGSVGFQFETDHATNFHLMSLNKMRRKSNRERLCISRESNFKTSEVILPESDLNARLLKLLERCVNSLPAGDDRAKKLKTLASLFENREMPESAIPGTRREGNRR